MTDDDLWLAPLRMQDHAATRIAERVGSSDVVGEIRVALLFGRFSPERPRWCDGKAYRAPEPLREERVYAWDSTFTRCWVLRRTSRVLYLVTVLLEQEHWVAEIERRRGVRAGSARA